MPTETHILVIDDDPQITTTLEAGLKDAGMIVTSTNTYDAGLEALREKPHLAVVDISLGGQSGLDLIREAKKDTALATDFMILTNSLNAEHVAEAMEIGITTFIQKADHDPGEIVQMIVDRLKK